VLQREVVWGERGVAFLGGEDYSGEAGSQNTLGGKKVPSVGPKLLRNSDRR